MNIKKSISESLLCRILWLYYVQEMNQREIADLLGLSRIKVVRLLKEGRERGLVDIRIKSDKLFLFDLEKELSDLTGLEKAWVVPAAADPIEAVGAGAVYRFQMALMKYPKISIASGRTHYAMSKHLPFMNNVVTDEIISIGAYDDTDFLYSPLTLGHMLTSKLNVKFFQVKVPAFSDSPEMLAAIGKSRLMQEAMKKAVDADISFTSVSSLETSRYLNYTQVSDSERKRLLRRKLVAEIEGNFFTEDGEVVDPFQSARIVLPMPRECPIVLVSGGPIKARAIAAVVRSGYIDELVIDEETARMVIAIFRNA